MIKGLRRSLKGEKRSSSQSNGSSGSGTGPKSSFATTPPKKIIKAMYDYTAQGPGELTFSKGDFLYVVGNEEDTEWYVACDPPSNLHGMVPVSYFEVVNRQEPIHTVPLTTLNHRASKEDPAGSAGAATAAETARHSAASSTSTRAKRQSSPLYGVVLYDFVAERADELQANAGESIIVIAQSNEEWFVAKPIGRLGGPGLIPVSYVEIREVGSDKPVTNVEEAVKKAGVPKVEEWKRMAAEYKASSIPLGTFEDDGVAAVSRQLKATSLQGQSQNHGGQQYHQRGSGISHQTTSQRSSGARYSNSPYVVAASVERYAFDGVRYWYLVVAELSNGRYRNLCRYYQDFYDFQIKLLEEFPDEAGRTGKPRILPFIPGPLTYVNDSISSQRRVDLHAFVRNLAQMPSYISRSPVVQQLFALRQGDVETPYLTNTMPQPPARESIASNEERQIQPGHVSSDGLPAGVQSHEGTHVQSHTRMASQATITANETGTSGAGGDVTGAGGVGPVAGAVAGAGTTESTASGTGEPQTASPEHPEDMMPPPSFPVDHRESTAGSVYSTSKQDFVKVKVFYQDDLIAIRVPSTIAFGELQARICERLGVDSAQLLYKDEASGVLNELSGDAEFADALSGRNKLVLYAK